MSETSELPPVLQALGDDLSVAMEAAVATARPASWRARVIWALPRAPRRAWIRLATVGVAAAAAAVTLLVFGPSGRGPANAFAGWTAIPTPPASGQLLAAETACKRRTPELASTTPTVWDTRGPDSLLVYAGRGATTTCVTGRIQLGTVAMSRVASNSLANTSAIAPQSLGLEFAADGQAFREMTGKVGAGVTAVTLVLESRSTIQATVAAGWFAAWWPVSPDFQTGAALAQSLGASVPRSFEITTASGTTTRPLTMDEIQQATTAPLSVSAVPGAATGSTGDTGSTGASGSTGSEPSRVDSALMASFAVLRQSLPNPVQLPSDIAGAYTGPAQPANPYGVDPNLAEYVASANTWILPGSSGVCLITIGIVRPGVGSGSCNSDLFALSGDFFVDSKKWPTRQIVLVGLAPDGNQTVSVTDADGSTHHVPVTDNLYVVTGGDPSSITLRDASGAPTTVPIP
jgi:hypothetical protein